jgi:nucleotide-binding universal stress UspA family protein
MYQRILVPLKMADGDQVVLEHAAGIGRLTGGALILCYVAHTHSRDASTTLRDRARRELDERARELRAQGLKVDVVLETGEPAEGILRVARSVDADLIVMASHGHSQVRHFLLGSVTEAVVRSDTFPVLLVRPGGNDEQPARVSAKSR